MATMRRTALYDRLIGCDPYCIWIKLALDLDHGTRRPDGGGLDFPGCRHDDAGPASDRVPSAVAGRFTFAPGTNRQEEQKETPDARPPGVAVMNNRVLASILVAAVAFMYVSIIIKMSE